MNSEGILARRAPETADCAHCFMEGRCWPDSVPRSGGVDVHREPVLQRSQFLWHEGDVFRGLFLVRSGCIKQYQITAQGEEQVLHFALPGDLLGLEFLTSARCESHAVALTDAMVCHLRWPPSDADAARNPQVERRLLQRASALLRQRTRQARGSDPTVALHAFLRDLAERLGTTDGATAGAGRRLRLPMSRLEIGQYLGYAEETICRSFQRLQHQGAVDVSGRTITLHGPVAGETTLR